MRANMKKIRVTQDLYKKIIFSGGEIHIEFVDYKVGLYDADPRMGTTLNLSKIEDYADKNNTVILLNIPLRNSENVMELFLLNSHFQALGYKTEAIISYMPYARQDRQTTPETLHSLKHFAKLINSCNFERVHVLDPHSLAVENAIDRVHAIPMHNVLKIVSRTISTQNKMDNDYNNVFKPLEYCFVSPDIGALKKVEACGKAFGVPVISAHKDRNPATGEIVGIKLLSEIPEGVTRALVLDDICDGGRTFIELIDKTQLKDKFESIDLFVTHGIFSKGVDILLENGYNTIYTTDSFCTLEHEKLVKIKL